MNKDQASMNSGQNLPEATPASSPMQKIQETLLKLPEMLKNMIPKKKSAESSPQQVATPQPTQEDGQASVEPAVQVQQQPAQAPVVQETTPTAPQSGGQANVPVSQNHSPLTTHQPPATQVSKKSNKGLIIGIIIFIIFITIMIVGMVMFGGLPNPTEILEPEVTLTPIPTPVEIIEQKSPYADDPGVLEIIEDLENYEKELNSTNIREDILRVPNVDWEVNFK